MTAERSADHWTTVGEAKTALQTRLSRLPHASPAIEAAMLLGHVLEKSRSWLFAWPEHKLLPEQAERLFELLSLRLNGAPMAHILGKREFWSREFRVTPDTLIPRPDTEILIEQALLRIPQTAQWTILDLGTGTGIIGATIAAERPVCNVIATDISDSALKVARENHQQLKLDNLQLIQGDWFETSPPLPGPLDMILSNPPYIPSGDPHLETGDLLREPRLALESGVDGLNALREIIAKAIDHMKPDGWLLVEHGYDQGDSVRALFKSAGFFQIESPRDLAGHERVTLGRKPLPSHPKQWAGSDSIQRSTTT